MPSDAWWSYRAGRSGQGRGPGAGVRAGAARVRGLGVRGGAQAGPARSGPRRSVGLLRDVRGPVVPGLHGHLRQQVAQRHHGEPEGPGPGLAVPRHRRAGQPGLREQAAAGSLLARSRGGTSSWAPASESRGDTGVWGSLSKVTNPYDTTSPPRRRRRCSTRTPSRSTTRRSRARPRSSSPTPSAIRPTAARSLWTQGGVPGDPVLTDKFPGPQYGFGALRCATDDVNGDNVEYIYFPAGIKHVFCYGIYVKPPPTSGEITIEKRVVGAPEGTSPTFQFNGDLSFDPGGFNLGRRRLDGLLPCRSAAHRAAGDLDGDRGRGRRLPAEPGRLQRRSTPTAVRGRARRWSTAARSTSTWSPGEHVTCLFTNTYVPPPGGLVIQQGHPGRSGQLRLHGHARSAAVRRTTSRPRPPIRASRPPPSRRWTRCDPGTYQIQREGARLRRRALEGGVGQLQRRPACIARRAVTVTITSGQASTCTFLTGSSRPARSRSRRSARAPSGRSRSSSSCATPNRRCSTPSAPRPRPTGKPAGAVPDAPADATDHLRLGRYLIVEQFPLSDPTDAWAVSSVYCNGVAQPFTTGAVEVHLTSRDPACPLHLHRCVHAEAPADPAAAAADPSARAAASAEASRSAPGARRQPDLRQRRPVGDQAREHPLGDRRPRDQLPGDRPQPRPRGRAAGVRRGSDDGSSPRSSRSTHRRARCRIRPTVRCSLGNLKNGARVVITARVSFRCARRRASSTTWRSAVPRTTRTSPTTSLRRGCG